VVVWPGSKNRQDKSIAGAAAVAASVACVSAGSIDRHVCPSWTGNHGGGDCDLQLLAAYDLCSHRCAVDEHDGRRNKLTAIYRERKALLYLSECRGAVRKRTDGWGRAGTSAQGIQCIAAGKHQQDEQKCAAGPRESAESSHATSYTRASSFKLNPGCCSERVIKGCNRGLA
jgi:hypothetical protein